MRMYDNKLFQAFNIVIKHGFCRPCPHEFEQVKCFTSECYEEYVNMIKSAVIMNSITKTFCEKCGEDTNYVIKETLLEGDVNGESFVFGGLMACCQKCQNDVYVKDVDYYNVAELYKARDRKRAKNDAGSEHNSQQEQADGTYKQFCGGQ